MAKQSTIINYNGSSANAATLTNLVAGEVAVGSDTHTLWTKTNGASSSTKIADAAALLSTYIVQTTTNAPANAQALGSLATGLLKVTTTTGVLSTAVAGTDYLGITGSLLNTVTDPATGTVTFNLAVSNLHIVTLSGNRTLALSNVTAGQTFTILLKQDGTGSRTVTWFSGISWQGGVVPTLTTAQSKTDTLTFIALTTSTFLGYVAGQNA